MKNKLGIWFLVSAFFMMTGCSSSPSIEMESEKTENDQEEVADFYKGADISWVTELESKGHKFYNAEGQERECTALMKEYGMNAIRLRVGLTRKNTTIGATRKICWSRPNVPRLLIWK